MVEMSPEEGDIQPEEQTMIRRLFSFSDTTVRDVMIPLVDVVSVERNMTCGEVKKFAAASHHKRLPVQWVQKTDEKDYHVSARVELDVLKELGLATPDGQYASLAGFLLEKVRDIPPVGTVIEFQGISFTVERATPQAIQEVRIQW